MKIRLYENPLTSLHMEPEMGQLIQAPPYSPATRVSTTPARKFTTRPVIGYIMGSVKKGIPGHISADEILVEQIMPYRKQTESEFIIPYSPLKRWSSQQTGKYRIIGQIEDITSSFKKEGELEGLLLLSQEEKDELHIILDDRTK